jgi:hypothetical protein
MDGTRCVKRPSRARSDWGAIAPGRELTARRAEIRAWEDTDEALRPCLARQMKIYAAFFGVRRTVTSAA